MKICQPASIRISKSDIASYTQYKQLFSLYITWFPEVGQYVSICFSWEWEWQLVISPNQTVANCLLLFYSANSVGCLPKEEDVWHIMNNHGWDNVATELQQAVLLIILFKLSNSPCRGQEFHQLLVKLLSAFVSSLIIKNFKLKQIPKVPGWSHRIM